MTVFVAAVDEGSLSAAGRRLQMPLATVSRKLAELEAHLGTRLVTRSTRQLALTEAGRDYLVAAREILERVDEAERGAAGVQAAPRGELVVAAPLVFGRLHVVPVVADYLARFADVNVRLLLSDRNANLLEEHVDTALRIGTLPDSGLVALRIGEIRRVTCASPAYLAARGTPLTPDELRGHCCVNFEGLMSSSSWSFAAGEATQRVPIHTRLAVTTADAAIRAVEAGLGITRVLSYQVAEALREGRLVRVLAAHEPPAVPVSLLYSRQGRLPMKTRSFLDFAVPQLQAALREAETQPAA